MLPTCANLKDATVLIVDDEHHIQDLLVATFSRVGAKPKAFDEAESCLAYLHDHPADVRLIISDQSLPGMSGLDLAHAVRSGGSATPFIIASGFSQTLDARTVEQLKPCRWLNKPYEIAEILVQASRLVGDPA